MEGVSVEGGPGMVMLMELRAWGSPPQRMQGTDQTVGGTELVTVRGCHFNHTCLPQLIASNMEWC